MEKNQNQKTKKRILLPESQNSKNNKKAKQAKKKRNVLHKIGVIFQT